MAVGWGTSALLPRASLCELSSCADLGFLRVWWLGAQSEFPRKREAGGSWIFLTTWTRASHGILSSTIYWPERSPAPLRFKRKEWRPHLLGGRVAVTGRQCGGRNTYIFAATFGKWVCHATSLLCPALLEGSAGERPYKHPHLCAAMRADRRRARELAVATLCDISQ